MHRPNIKLRLHLLWELLQSNRNQPISFTALKQELDRYLKEETRFGALEDDLIRLRTDRQRPGVLLKIHGKATDKDQGSRTVELRLNDEPLIDEERRAFPELKRNLGAVVWHYLFNIPLPEGVHSIEPAGKTDDLNRKIPALQTKSTVSIAVDAGSTTEYAIEQLLSVDQIPIRVKTHPATTHAPTGGNDAQRPDLYRLIVPTITTNSITIANVVLDSFHRRNIQVRLTGGELHLDRRSICGPLTELSLLQWNTRGDIALVGTTSFLPSGSTSAIAADTAPGAPAFACDNVSEAWLKATFLERAWFRILILHSGKLLKQEGTSVFAPLSNALIDLVVIDDGREIDADRRAKGEVSPDDNSAEQAVHAFLEAANKAQVPVLRLKTDPRKGA